MARKRGGAHGGHGWFVTFADLMALLMSFFVVVAAFSTQDQKKLQLVAGSMRDAFGSTKDSRLAGIVEQDGIPTREKLRNARNIPPEESSDRAGPTERDANERARSRVERNRSFALASASLRQALQDMPDILEISKNIIVEDTKEGFNIAIVDQDGRSMFGRGSTQPYERARKILDQLAPTLRRLSQRITVTGHTATMQPGERAEGSPWELSSGRASVVRDILASGGVPDDRFAAIGGKSDVEPLFPDNPYLAANRRVTISLMNEAPLLPPDVLKP